MTSQVDADNILQTFRSLECKTCRKHFGYQSRNDPGKEDVFCSTRCIINGSQEVQDPKVDGYQLQQNEIIKPKPTEPTKQQEQGFWKPVNEEVIKKVDEPTPTPKPLVVAKKMEEPTPTPKPLVVDTKVYEPSPAPILIKKMDEPIPTAKAPIILPTPTPIIKITQQSDSDGPDGRPNPFFVKNSGKRGGISASPLTLTRPQLVASSNENDLDNMIGNSGSGVKRTMLSECKLSERLANGSVVGGVFQFSTTRVLIGSGEDDGPREAMQAELTKLDCAPYKGVPVVGELVVGKYLGENYRGVIIALKDNNKARLEFIDYGDSAINDISELGVLPDHFMNKYPIYGLIVNLSVKNLTSSVPSEFTDALYTYPLTLQFLGKNASRPSEYDVDLWMTPQKTLNSLLEAK